MALYSVQTGNPPAAADLNQIIALLSGQSGPLAGGITVSNRIRAQLTGATATSGLVGMVATPGSTVGGPPTSGTWAAGDLMTDPVLLCLWVCVTAGTPGTWFRIGGGNTAGGMLMSQQGQGLTQRTGRTGFDVMIFDTNSSTLILNMPGVSTSLSAITMQYPGLYLFFGNVSVTGGTSGADIAAMLLKNGSIYEIGAQFLGYGAPGLAVSSLIQCAVGDVIQLAAYSEGNYSVTALGYSQILLYGLHVGN